MQVFSGDCYYSIVTQNVYKILESCAIVTPILLVTLLWLNEFGTS